MAEAVEEVRRDRPAPGRQAALLERDDLSEVLSGGQIAALRRAAAAISEHLSGLGVAHEMETELDPYTRHYDACSAVLTVRMDVEHGAIRTRMRAPIYKVIFDAMTPDERRGIIFDLGVIKRA